jgi:hypothetical protein
MLIGQVQRSRFSAPSLGLKEKNFFLGAIERIPKLGREIKQD